MTRPFRFAVQLSQPLPGRNWADSARELEDAGVSTAFIPDHFGDQHGPLVALTAMAAATETLRVGALVFDNDYRHPVVLAKEIATLDLISEGRVEFGLGAGWMTSDYVGSGIPLDSPGVRIERLAEALTIYKGLWAESGSVTFEGEHYQVKAQAGFPKPHRLGGPPILIGGGGKRVLSLAAREADIVGISASLKAGVINTDAALDSMAAAVDQKVAWVKEAAGERFEDIELNVLSFAFSITDDPTTLSEQVAPLFGVSAADVVEAPSVVIATESGARELLEARRERWGISYYSMQAGSFHDARPVIAALSGQ